jgi:hypothetical protein
VKMSFLQALRWFREWLTEIHHLPDGSFFQIVEFCRGFVEFSANPLPSLTDGQRGNARETC